jgi:hypothetical protein
MVDYIFSDGQGHFVPVRTDAVNTNTNNFTIESHPGFIAPNSPLDLLPVNLRILFGRSLDRLQTNKAAMIALAVTVGMNLVAIEIGGPSNAAAPVVLSSQTLVAPGSFVVATGSGATGTMALTWAASVNANNYILDRATNVGFTTGVVLGVFSGSGLAFNDSGLTGATIYFYRLRAQGLNYTDSAFSTGTATSHA